MDLAYGPGELDQKIPVRPDSSNLKREHDSVDDFEHLDPELSPVGVQKKEFPHLDNDDAKRLEHDSLKNDKLIDPLMAGSASTDLKSVSSDDFFPSNILTPAKDFVSEFESRNEDLGFQETEAVSNFVDFGKGGDTSLLKEPEDFEENAFNTSFISAEKASKFNDKETDNESDLLNMESTTDSLKNVQETSEEFGLKKSAEASPEEEFLDNTKSMKEVDALSHYSLKLDKKEDIERKESPTADVDHDSDPVRPTYEQFGSDSLPLDMKNFIAICPAKPEHDLKNSQEELHTYETENSTPKPLNSETSIASVEILEPDVLKQQLNAEEEDEHRRKELVSSNPLMDAGPNEPTFTLNKDSVKSAKKNFVPDLDDIIGPDDVFKRIGLDAWFTPDRLHPTVEALVYWRDPKQSGVVFGSIMAILLSLCYMSLISVVAYSSLLALVGTVCFRIYKNILQAVQKTSEGHPFKEYLDIDLSLPQDKVRESVDTAVVHINASLVELRRLFLVEDLIDSIKFAVCLWCLTYVGAIFNGMTLVILAFVALFTVPKIYENNKASIDQYIDMGRSKVAEITSKVKAALPVGKKEPEKDKEQ